MQEATNTLPTVAVRRSSIHGKGLFAARPIAAGETIGHLRGELTVDNGPYVLWVDERFGIRGDNDIRYVNHSPRPNAVYYDDGSLVALDDIAAGEEITHDYGETWR